MWLFKSIENHPFVALKMGILKIAPNLHDLCISRSSNSAEIARNFPVVKLPKLNRVQELFLFYLEEQFVSIYKGSIFYHRRMVELKLILHYKSHGEALLAPFQVVIPVDEKATVYASHRTIEWSTVSP